MAALFEWVSTAVIGMHTWGTRETVQPPQPAPVKREPRAPAFLHTLTSSSSSSQLQLYKSLYATFAI